MNTPTQPAGRAAARLLFAAAAFASTAGAADISLKNAWMRPVRAGAPTAAVYVDIATDVPLKLVGARSPAAKSAAFVLVDPNADGPSPDRVVKEVDLPAGKQWRFAYNGSRIDLREIKDDLWPGTNVPLTLEFVEAKGDRKHSIEIGVLVRGVILPAPPETGGSPADAPK